MPGRGRQPGQGIEPVPVVAAEGAGGGQEEGQGEPVAQRRGVPAQLGRPGGIGPVGRDRRQHPALGGGEHGGAADPALALGGMHAAARQQGGQPAIGGAAAGPGQPLRAVVEPEAAADPEGQAGRLGRDMAADHAGEAVQVADAEPGQAERLRGLHQLLRVRGAVEEAEVGPGAQLGEGSHGGPRVRCCAAGGAGA